MAARFGLPCTMFTITPDDAFNFRIKIMSMLNNSEYCKPPSVTESDEVLSEFVVECNRTRVTYPGLCAIDFQNIIEITIRHLLGWNQDKRENISDVGLFGDLDAFSYCVEEQGM